MKVQKQTRKSGDDGLIVMVDLDLPKFAAERRYIELEREHIEERLDFIADHPWQGLGQSLLGQPERRHWEKYQTALSHYETALEQEEAQLGASVIPFQIAVLNDAEHGVGKLRITIDIEDAEVLPKHLPPHRPARLDGAQLPPKSSIFDLFSGFTRSKVVQKPHQLAATFSGLGPDDGALVINQPVYIKVGKAGKLLTTIESPHGTQQTVIALAKFRKHLAA